MMTASYLATFTGINTNVGSHSPVAIAAPVSAQVGDTIISAITLTRGDDTFTPPIGTDVTSAFTNAVSSIPNLQVTAEGTNINFSGNYLLQSSNQNLEGVLILALMQRG